jgi:hypothetical protein
MNTDPYYGADRALGGGPVQNTGQAAAGQKIGTISDSQRAYMDQQIAATAMANKNAARPVAMARGGVINEPIHGVGQSGQQYLLGENGPETVMPGIHQQHGQDSGAYQSHDSGLTPEQIHQLQQLLGRNIFEPHPGGPIRRSKTNSNQSQNTSRAVNAPVIHITDEEVRQLANVPQYHTLIQALIQADKRGGVSVTNHQTGSSVNDTRDFQGQQKGYQTTTPSPLGPVVAAAPAANAAATTSAASALSPFAATAPDAMASAAAPVGGALGSAVAQAPDALAAPTASTGNAVGPMISSAPDAMASAAAPTSALGGFAATTSDLLATPPDISGIASTVSAAPGAVSPPSGLSAPVQAAPSAMTPPSGIGGLGTAMSSFSQGWSNGIPGESPQQQSAPDPYMTQMPDRTPQIPMSSDPTADLGAMLAAALKRVGYEHTHDATSGAVMTPYDAGVSGTAPETPTEPMMRGGGGGAMYTI